MTAQQLTLAPLPPTQGTARENDPPSSKESARRTRPKKDQQDVLAALVANGGTGTLDDVCEALPRKLRNALSRRLTDLETAQQIRKTGEMVEGNYGRPVAVWEVIR